MTKIADLPKDPTQAFQHVLTELLEVAHTLPNGGTLSGLQKTVAISKARALQAISIRLTNPEDYQEPLQQLLGCLNSASAKNMLSLLGGIEMLFYANSLQDHFVDAEEEDNYNTLRWTGDDRNDVLLSLQRARQFVTFSENLKDEHKRRVLYWISKAEAEALKDKGKFATILAATDEIGETVKRLGENAKPLAELVRMVRTTTRRNVTENLQIEGPKEPKKLPAPTSDA
ncbi:hypothetical protein LCM08_20725 [Salipiger pacificus]|nr:hypothetical protein [Alloyangia pacifica]